MWVSSFILTTSVFLDMPMMSKVRGPIRFLASLIMFSSSLLLASVHRYLDRDPFSFPIATPDFRAFTNASDKRQAFFQYLLPAIRAVNAGALLDRKKLQHIALDITEAEFTGKSQHALDQLAEKYRLKTDNLALEDILNELLIRVDGLPESLVLAHAVLESGWGTSVFATEAKNYFNQRCYTPGCGLVPAEFDADRAYELRRFDQVEDSVQAYLLEINSEDEYVTLRRMRADMRASGELNNLTLAEALQISSENNSGYADKIRTIIRANDLSETAIGY